MLCDADWQAELKRGLAYELWVLGLVEDTVARYSGQVEQGLCLTSGNDSAQILIVVKENICAAAQMEVLNALSPLTFSMCFKTLDVIFSSILEINCRAQGIPKKVPEKTVEKIKYSCQYRQVLEYPRLFKEKPEFLELMYELYKTLRPYRNEVTHGCDFQLTGEGLVVRAHEKKQTTTLTIDWPQLDALGRTVLTVGRLLAGDLDLCLEQECLLKYYLDQLAVLHHGKEFGQTEKPRRIRVELKLPSEQGGFTLDLDWVQRRVQAVFPGQCVLWDLLVLGQANGETIARWFFPCEAVPRGGRLEFGLDAYPERRVP